MLDYREAKDNELDSILRLYEQLNPDERSLSPEKATEIWNNIKKVGLIKYFVAVDDDKVVSTCYLVIIPNLSREGYSIGFIENVVTDINYRRKGIGRKLMKMVIEYARSNNCYKVVLQSSNKREEAHLFYSSLGFRGDTKKAYEIRFGC